MWVEIVIAASCVSLLVGLAVGFALGWHAREVVPAKLADWETRRRLRMHLRGKERQ